METSKEEQKKALEELDLNGVKFLEQESAAADKVRWAAVELQRAEQAFQKALETYNEATSRKFLLKQVLEGKIRMEVE